MEKFRPTRLYVISVGVVSQVGWFAAVLGAAHGHAWAGPAFAVLAVPLGAWLLGEPRRILTVAAVAMGVGLVVETTLIANDLVSYREPGAFAPLPPLWLVSLWALFALVIETALVSIAKRPFVQAGLAALGGPLAYLAGEKLQAMTFLEPRIAGLTALALLWAIALPAIMRVRGMLQT